MSEPQEYWMSGPVDGSALLVFEGDGLTFKGILFFPPSGGVDVVESTSDTKRFFEGTGADNESTNHWQFDFIVFV
jgi:hypothetical protein